MPDEMAEAIGRQMDRRREAHAVNRRDWTAEQWCEDAKRLMREPDGAITSLVNGHASCLIQERDRLLAEVWQLSLALELACADGWTDVIGARRQYLSKAAAVIQAERDSTPD